MRIIPVTLVLCAEAAVYCGLCYSTAAQSSATYDEQSHMLAGYVKLTEGDFRFVPEHPHLAQIWAALPLRLMEIVPPRQAASPSEWEHTETWPISARWLHKSNEPMRLLMPARMMITVLGLVLGGLVVAAAWVMAGCAENGARDGLRNQDLGTVGVEQGQRARGRTGGITGWAGPAAGMIAGGIFALSPAMIAHGSLVTTDMAAALGIFVATLAAARFMARSTIANGALLGLAAGVAMMLKFSFLLIVPGLLGWWILSIAVKVGRGGVAAQRVGKRRHAHGPGDLAMRDPRPGVPDRATRGACAPSTHDLAGPGAGDWVGPGSGDLAETGFQRMAARGFPGIATAMVCFAGVVWGCYGFRYAMVPASAGSFQRLVPALPYPKNPWAWSLEDAGVSGVMAAFVRDHRLMPESLIWGITYAAREARNRVSYFLGRTRAEGSWGYFPVLFLLKTPISTLILLALGLFTALRSKIGIGERLRNARPFAIGAAFVVVSYAALAMSSSFNIGHRHLLPIYPFLYVAAALTATRLAFGSRAGKAILVVLGVWWVVGAVRSHPDELAYFNEAIGSAENAAYVAVDSNLDWGQDMLKLARIQREKGWGEMKFSYFGSGDPGAYGMRAKYLMGTDIPEGSERATISAGVYAISLSCLRLAVTDLGFATPINDWSAELSGVYADLLSKAAATTAPSDVKSASETERMLATLRFVKLITALRARTPDAVAGKSVNVYVVSQAELEEMLAPAAAATRR